MQDYFYSVRTESEESLHHVFLLKFKFKGSILPEPKQVGHIIFLGFDFLLVLFLIFIGHNIAPVLDNGKRLSVECRDLCQQQQTSSPNGIGRLAAKGVWRAGHARRGDNMPAVSASGKVQVVTDAHGAENRVNIE